MNKTLADIYGDGIRLRAQLRECLLTTEEINSLASANDQRWRALVATPRPGPEVAAKLEEDIELAQHRIDRLFKPFQDVRRGMEGWSVRCWDGLADTPRVREQLRERLEALMRWRSPVGLPLGYAEADQILGLICEDLLACLDPIRAAIAKFEGESTGQPVSTGIIHSSRVKKLNDYLKERQRSKADLYRSLQIDKADYYRWERNDTQLTPGIKERLDQFVDSLPG